MQHLRSRGNDLWRTPIFRAFQRTALFNIGNAIMAGTAGIILTRLLGPAGRGEYALLMSWFGLVLLIGELGQTASVTYYVARFPERANDYVATTRRILLVCLVPATVVLLGVAAAFPGRRTTLLVLACAVALSFLAAPTTYGLQATRFSVWNWVRSSQPAFWLLGIGLLAITEAASVAHAMVVLTVSVGAQLVVSLIASHSSGLTGGSYNTELARPLVTYGAKQLTAAVPLGLLRQVDIIVLSALATAAVVGQYSVAMAYCMLGFPIAAALGSVLFPSQARSADPQLLVRRGLVGAAVVSLATTGPLAAVSPWLLPLLYGQPFDGAVALVFLLTPAVLFFNVNQVLGDLLRGVGEPGQVARGMWMGLGVLGVTIWPLFLLFGASGVATSVTAGNLMVFTHLWRRMRISRS